MKKQKLSGPAVFMYSVIVFVLILSAVCFTLYYSGTSENGVVLWTGIVAFMVLYHFGLRILMGEVMKRFKTNHNHGWYKQRFFEKPLYKLLRVRKWKDKVLTFDPAAYDIKCRTLEQLAETMSKSERDHWINEAISALSITFFLFWGCLPAFLISAIVAMIFDAQFIIVQRYNRPIVLKLIERHKMRKTRITA